MLSTTHTYNLVFDFMRERPRGKYVILMPLRLKPDLLRHENSKFVVLIRDIEHGENILADIAPELIFTKFRIGQHYINGRKVKTHTLHEMDFTIDTSSNYVQETKLGNLLREDEILNIAGWDHSKLDLVNDLSCCVFNDGPVKIIIPQYAISSYYCFRSTSMREAAFGAGIKSLYTNIDDTEEKSIITIKKGASPADAPFIYRFAKNGTANTSFENQSNYLKNCIKLHKEQKSDFPLESIPLIGSFPVKEKFTVKCTYTRIRSNGAQTTYFIHEILDDNSSIEFNNLEIRQIVKAPGKRSEKSSGLPFMQMYVPETTSEILKNVNASKSYLRSNIPSSRNRSCKSLDGKHIEYRQVAEPSQSDVGVIYTKVKGVSHQSLFDAVSIETETPNVRKVSISQKKKLETIVNPKEYKPNFDTFLQYMEYLQKSGMILNLVINEIPEPFPDSYIAEQLNPKCVLNGLARHYITATFVYKNLFAGLLDIENSGNAPRSTWVIVSKVPVTQSIFEHFVDSYIYDNKSTDEMKRDHKSNGDLGFFVKYHKHNENLSEVEMSNWAKTLLEKVRF